MDESNHIKIRHFRDEDRNAVVALARELQANEQAMFDRMRSAILPGRG